MVCPYWRRRLQQSQLLHCPSHHAGYLPGFLITQCHCYPQLLLQLGNLPEHDFQSVWCHCPWWFPTRCCFLQPAFPDDLVTLVLLNPVFCVLSAGRPGRLCRFRNHGTKEFRAGKFPAIVVLSGSVSTSLAPSLQTPLVDKPPICAGRTAMVWNNAGSYEASRPASARTPIWPRHSPIARQSPCKHNPLARVTPLHA